MDEKDQQNEEIIEMQNSAEKANSVDEVEEDETETNTVTQPVVAIQEEEEEDWEDPFPHDSIEDLETKLHEQLKKEQHLQIECDLTGHFLERNKNDTDGTSSRSRTATTKRHSANRLRSRDASRTKLAPPTKQLQLKPAQKAALASKEIEEVQQLFERQKQQDEVARQHLEAAIEEQKLRLQEIARQQSFLDSEIKNTQAQNQGKIYSEFFVQYYEKMSKEIDQLLDKLRLKHAMALTSRSKLDDQLRYKSDSGNTLQQVDFDELRIVNRGLAEKVDESSQKLVRLKARAGKLDQQLNNYKSNLDKLTQENQGLEQDVKQRQRLLKSIERELDQVEKQLISELKSSKKLTQKLESKKAPSVMEFVSKTAEVPKLQSTVKTLKRQTDVAGLEYRATRRHLNKLGDSGKILE